MKFISADSSFKIVICSRKLWVLLKLIKSTCARVNSDWVVKLNVKAVENINVKEIFSNSYTITSGKATHLQLVSFVENILYISYVHKKLNRKKPPPSLTCPYVWVWVPNSECSMFELIRRALVTSAHPRGSHMHDIVINRCLVALPQLFLVSFGAFAPSIAISISIAISQPSPPPPPKYF